MSDEIRPLPRMEIPPAWEGLNKTYDMWVDSWREERGWYKFAKYGDFIKKMPIITCKEYPPRIKEMFDPVLLKKADPLVLHGNGWPDKTYLFDEILFTFIPPSLACVRGFKFAQKAAILDDAWVVKLRQPERMFEIIKRAA